MPEKEEIRCINCGEPMPGSFCIHCGQPSKPERLTLLSLWSDYFGRVFNLDTKFLRTVKDLFIRPGVVSREFVLGNRVRYIPPVSYFVILTTLYIIFLSLINVGFYDIMATSGQAVSPGDVSPEQLKVQQKLYELFVKNMRILFFLQIPFVALWGRIIFKKSGFNYIENTVLAFYIHGHFLWLNIATAIAFKFTGELFNGITMLLAAIYFSWSCAAFYNVSNPKGFFKGLLVHFLMLLTFAITMFLLVVVGFMIYVKWINPEFINS